METRDAIRSVVENIPGICQLKPKQEECLVFTAYLQRKFEAAETAHNIRHNQTLCDWLTGTPMILNFRQASPHEKVNTCQLCPSRLSRVWYYQAMDCFVGILLVTVQKGIY